MGMELYYYAFALDVCDVQMLFTHYIQYAE